MRADEQDAIAEANRREGGRQTDEYVRKLNGRRRPTLSYEETTHAMLRACSEIMFLDLEAFAAQTKELCAATPAAKLRLISLLIVSLHAKRFRRAGIEAAHMLAEHSEDPEAALRNAE